MRLEFAIAGSVNVGKGRAGGDQALGVGNALGGAENFEELIALAGDAAKQTKLLEDQGPGDQGKEKQDCENATRDQAGLRKNIKNIADDDGG